MSTVPRLHRAAWPVAVLCAVWTAVFTADEPRGALAAVPLVLAGVVLLPRDVRAGTGLVLLAGFVSLAAGVSWGNVDSVVPLAVALFALGRLESSRPIGVAAVLTAATASSLRDGIAAEKVAITVALFGAMWLFGVVVRQRALEALAAVARAERLASKDPTMAAEQHAIEERSRLAEEALRALRTAVVDMRTTARQAATRLDPRVVRAVHERGSVAVDELRALLGLLREAPAVPDDDPSGPTVRRVPVLGSPVAWCTTLAVGTLGLVAAPPQDPNLLLPGAAAYAFVAWRVAVRPTRARVVALAILAVCATWLSTSYGMRGTAFVLFVLGAASLAGLAWDERDRIYRDAEDRAHRLRARLTEATSSAVRIERLRLARELHDVAGHAVGAMVLQAGAAAALLERDPAAARRALRTVDETGEAALREVDEMLAALDAGELDHTVRSYAEPGRLRLAIEDLVRRTAAAGTRVTATLHDLPTSSALTAVTFRVVHEGVMNAARHAPGARVEIVTRLTADGYVVRVSDDGGGTSTRPGTGYGLAGLRERVLACGGTLEAGPGPERGFVLEARLPVGPQEPSA